MDQPAPKPDVGSIAGAGQASAGPASAGPARSGAVLRPLAWVDREIQSLHPASFALVMATGIISNALFFNGRFVLSDALLAVNLVGYPWLLAATIWRLARFRGALWADLINPRLVFAVFTIVAATDVLGIQLDLRGAGEAARALWGFALLVWLVLGYFAFAVLIVLNGPRRADVISGGWLLAIVATQSLVLLGARIAVPMTEPGAVIAVLIHMLWGIGLALYGLYMALLAYRIFFLDVEPDDITPVLWVVMGAAAISANA